MSLSSHRRRIDHIDREILTLISERMELSKHIAVLKGKGVIEDANREQELLTVWSSTASDLGLSPDVALSVLRTLLAESKRVQKQFQSDNRFC